MSTIGPAAAANQAAAAVAAVEAEAPTYAETFLARYTGAARSYAEAFAASVEDNEKLREMLEFILEVWEFDKEKRHAFIAGSGLNAAFKDDEAYILRPDLAEVAAKGYAPAFNPAKGRSMRDVMICLQDVDPLTGEELPEQPECNKRLGRDSFRRRFFRFPFGRAFFDKVTPHGNYLNPNSEEYSKLTENQRKAVATEIIKARWSVGYGTGAIDGHPTVPGREQDASSAMALAMIYHLALQSAACQAANVFASPKAMAHYDEIIGKGSESYRTPDPVLRKFILGFQVDLKPDDKRPVRQAWEEFDTKPFGEMPDGRVEYNKWLAKVQKAEGVWRAARTASHVTYCPEAYFRVMLESMSTMNQLNKRRNDQKQLEDVPHSQQITLAGGVFASEWSPLTRERLADYRADRAHTIGYDPLIAQHTLDAPLADDLVKGIDGNPPMKREAAVKIAARRFAVPPAVMADANLGTDHETRIPVDDLRMPYGTVYSPVIGVGFDCRVEGFAKGIDFKRTVYQFLILKLGRGSEAEDNTPAAEASAALSTSVNTSLFGTAVPMTDHTALTLPDDEDEAMAAATQAAEEVAAAAAEKRKAEAPPPLDQPSPKRACLPTFEIPTGPADDEE